MDSSTSIDAKVAGIGSLGALLMAGTALAQSPATTSLPSVAAAVSMDAASRDGSTGLAAYRDGEFHFTDEAGNNTLNLGGFALFRYHASERSGDPTLSGAGKFTHGFQFATVETHAQGTIGSPDTSYMISMKFDPTGTLKLQEAWMGLQFPGTPWSLRAGQFTAAVLRERSVSQEVGLAVERSQVDSLFNLDYSQGIELRYEAQQYRAIASLTDGFRSATRASVINSPYDSTSEADYGLSLRGEWMFSGSDWSRFDQFSSWRSNPTYAGMIGAAIAFQYFGGTGATTPVANGTDLTYTIDVSTQGTGWNTLLAFVGNRNNTDGFIENETYGFVAQGGYFVSDQAELFARYEWIRLDPASVSGTDHSLNFLTIGANYFLVPESEAIRLTGDIVYAVNKTDGLLATSDLTTGLLGDAKAGEVDLRLQISIRY